MKRLALLSLAAMMFASAVFAPVAVAQVPGEVNVQSVELGPGGSVIVTSTIECVEGQRYDVGVTVRQRTSGNVFLVVSEGEGGVCPSTGPLTFTFTAFAEKPFHRGQATVQTFGRICAPDFSGCEPVQTSVEQVRIS